MSSRGRLTPNMMVMMKLIDQRLARFEILVVASIEFSSVCLDWFYDLLILAQVRDYFDWQIYICIHRQQRISVILSLFSITVFSVTYFIVYANGIIPAFKRPTAGLRPPVRINGRAQCVMATSHIP